MAMYWRVLIARILRLAVVDQSIPIEDVSRELHVVVGKFTDLSIVHTKDLSFFTRTKSEAWDEIHEEEDDTGTAERVGETRDRISKLFGELDPVVIEPSPRDHGKAV